MPFDARPPSPSGPIQWLNSVRAMPANVNGNETLGNEVFAIVRLHYRYLSIRMSLIILLDDIVDDVRLFVAAYKHAVLRHNQHFDGSTNILLFSDSSLWLTLDLLTDSTRYVSRKVLPRFVVGLSPLWGFDHFSHLWISVVMCAVAEVTLSSRNSQLSAISACRVLPGRASTTGTALTAECCNAASR